jgi:hypothetical protein
MKLAVINFSGNVGKTTVARHLLAPRIPGASVLAIESINADEGQAQALRGRQFGELQAWLQTVDAAVVDIGASNVEELLSLMRRYRGSETDFDAFVVPTVPAAKQQQDTIATLAELARFGIGPERIRVVFNQADDGLPIDEQFSLVLSYAQASGTVEPDTRCRLGVNEVYECVKGSAVDLAALARDDTDYKRLIAQAASTADKLVLAQRLATRRLACGVLPELDACFEALKLRAVQVA